MILIWIKMEKTTQKPQKNMHRNNYKNLFLPTPVAFATIRYGCNRLKTCSKTCTICVQLYQLLIITKPLIETSTCTPASCQASCLEGTCAYSQIACCFRLLGALETLLIIINLIYIAQFDTNGIPHSAAHSHSVHTNAVYAHMNIHETIIFIYMHLSTHRHIHRHMYKYICIYRHTNKIAHTHITNFSAVLVEVKSSPVFTAVRYLRTTEWIFCQAF